MIIILLDWMFFLFVSNTNLFLKRFSKTNKIETWKNKRKTKTKQKTTKTKQNNNLL